MSSPSARFGFSLFHDPNGGTILFGGDVNNPAATEWHWSGTEWSALTTPVPRRNDPACATYEPTGAVIVFGGQGSGGVPLYDTWSYDGSAWSTIATANTPPSLVGMSMAYDPRSGAMVLVGQNGANFETWQLIAGEWLQSQASLSVTAGVRLFSDTVHGEVGAFSVEPPYGLVVRLLHAGQWQQAAVLAGSFGPGTVCFDSHRGRAIWFDRTGGTTARTIEWDGLHLRSQAVASSPPWGLAQAMTFDPARRESQLVSCLAATDVWTWAPVRAPLASSFGSPCADPQFRLQLAAGSLPQTGANHRLLATGSPNNGLAIAMLGLSHTFDGSPLPRVIPFGPAGCQQRVQVLTSLFLGVGLPANLQVTVPNDASFLGVRYDAQLLLLDGSGVFDASNGLEVQVGTPVADAAQVESFADESLRDATTSGDVWSAGRVLPVAIGGDGRHGTFDPTIGTLVGPNEYLWDTTSITFPSRLTISGNPEIVTDGRFYFTDLDLPAGITVRLVGPVPAQIFVRGKATINGTITVNGIAMTDFDGRGGTLPTGPFMAGQPGGFGGPGGGRGGKGGDECPATGTLNLPAYSGQDGDPVQLLAGHAYASNAAGTGGHGGTLFPDDGRRPVVPSNGGPPVVANLYNPFFSSGGSGGGFSSAGGTFVVTTTLANLQFNAAPVAGAAFPLFPFPPVSAPTGYSSLNHFLIGGSGGGGGGSHGFTTYGIINTQDAFVAGAGGSGGGGAFALRAGNDLMVGNAAHLEAKGGAGALIQGHTSGLAWGLTSPGGGGSGGSFLLQSGRNLDMFGGINTSGGDGSRIANSLTSTLAALSCRAGAGSPGFYRLEAGGTVTVSPGANTMVPTYSAATNIGVLGDVDARTGSRSLWIQPPTLELPRYVRYELIADVGGSTVLFSDDPSVSGLSASDPNGPVVLRVQGARVNAIGQVLESTKGPWRTQVIAGGDSLNQDRAQALRFDIVLDKSAGAVDVRQLRIFWR